MALRPAGKTLTSFTGIVVLAAVLWALLNFVYAPSCGRFSCSYVPSWWPQAHADTGDGCPDDITAAATDSEWAADRYASIKDDKITTGLFYDSDGTEHTVTSGSEEISARILALLKSSGKVDMPPVGPHPVATHVEAKVAMMMREGEVTKGVLVINNEEGPCPGAYSCTTVLPAILAPGATLTVWWPGMHERTFVGRGLAVTTVKPRVVSAISGGAHRPWHYAHTDTERHDLIRRLLGEAHGHVLLYVWDRPAGGDTNQFPRQQLKIVYTARIGAAHYTNSDPEHGPVGAWLAHTDQPPADPPTVVYDPWDPERVTLPATALLPVDQLREIAEDYATTGQRPTGVQWAPVEWV